MPMSPSAAPRAMREMTGSGSGLRPMIADIIRRAGTRAARGIDLSASCLSKTTGRS